MALVLVHYQLYAGTGGRHYPACCHATLRISAHDGYLDESREALTHSRNPDRARADGCHHDIAIVCWELCLSRHPTIRSLLNDSSHLHGPRSYGAPVKFSGQVLRGAGAVLKPVFQNQ